MTVCVAGSQYIPSIEYFAHWMRNGLLTLEAHEHYQKRTWRNKTAILGPEIPLILTVPLQKGKHQQLLIGQVAIAYDEPWYKNHMSAIKTAYGKTAYFNEIASGLEHIYLSGISTLWELNKVIIEFIIDLLPGEWRSDLTDHFHHHFTPQVVDLRHGVPAGLYAQPGLPYPVYQQVQRLHKTHLPNLSILDALCHLGPDTYTYLDKYATILYDSHD